jgi:hypothetical protein
MGRPPVIDLTGAKFGALEVLGKTGDVPPLWDCLCKCCLHVHYRTEQLRWKGKKDCGCGAGRNSSPSLESRVPRSYLFLPDMKDLIPAEVLDSLGMPSKRPCSICGMVPGRRLVPVYSAMDCRFLKTRSSVDGYLTLCGICYMLAKTNRLCRSSILSPENWHAVAEKRLGDPRVRPAGMLGMFRVLLQNQSDDERTSLQGSKVRELAEIALDEDAERKAKAEVPAQ